MLEVSYCHTERISSYVSQLKGRCARTFGLPSPTNWEKNYKTMRDEGLLWVGTLNLERRRIAGSFVRLSGLTRMSLVYQLGSRE